MSVPGELALAGYDNTSLDKIRRISLNSIDPDNAGIAANAARMLISPEFAAAGSLLVRPQLIVRESSRR